MFAFAGLAYLWTYFFVCALSLPVPPSPAPSLTSPPAHDPIRPETYAPALLRAKAKKLQKAAGGDVFFVSRFDKLNTMTKSEIIKVNVRLVPVPLPPPRGCRLLADEADGSCFAHPSQMTRPFVLLFKEPIVLCLSIYTAII